MSERGLHSEFEGLRGERVWLRPLRAGDAAVLQAYRSNPDIAYFQSWDTDYSLEDGDKLVAEMAAASFGKPGSWYQIGITVGSATGESGVLIGDIGVYFDPDETGAAEIGYTLGEAHHGKGLATEAVALLLSYLAAQHGIARVKAVTDIRNQPSRALLRRLGFRETRVLEQSGFYKGQWCDEVECFWAPGVPGPERL
jgi:aminoglycoside 6'-N-acetyltransferase